jgi:hypothetical protein
LLRDLIQELVSDVIGLEVASVFVKRRPSLLFAEYGFIPVPCLVTRPERNSSNDLDRLASMDVTVHNIAKLAGKHLYHLLAKLLT